MRSMIAFGLCSMLAVTCIGATDEAKPQGKERFDMTVREDFFAGFQGDDEALARGFKKCDAVLAKNSKHAEAMVWRGAGRVFQAGQLFQKQKPAEALPLWTSGLKDLDDAVAIEPNNVGVRIPRAAVLLPAGRLSPPVMGKPLLAKALQDFETIYKMQEKDLSKLGTHPHGELRMGMADAYRLVGERDKSKAQLEAIVKELPGSKYEARAKEWLAAKPDAKLEHNCIGCHTKK